VTPLGNDGRGDHCCSSSLQISSFIANQRENMADPKGAKHATPIDGSRVDARNAIDIAMEDLAEKIGGISSGSSRRRWRKDGARNWRVSRKRVTTSSRRRSCYIQY
jgi:hypothetical protein